MEIMTDSAKMLISLKSLHTRINGEKLWHYLKSILTVLQ